MSTPTTFAFIDGVRTPRPAGQDIQPKAFGRKDPKLFVAFSEPTDRLVLWFIANYPFAFNVFFTTDFFRWMAMDSSNIDSVNNHPITKHLKVVKSLEDRHLIKFGDKQRLTYKVTFKGQLYRLYTNTTFQVIAIVLGVLLAAIAIIIPIFTGS